MNQKIINLIILILTLISFGCKENKLGFENNRKYIGFRTETKWVYKFSTNGKYVLETEGHGEGNLKNGSYLIKDSIILLLAETEFFEDWRFKRLKIDSPDCLRDYWGYFYCKTEQALNEISEKRFWQERQLRDSIENLKIVTTRRQELINQDSTKNYVLKNKGIIVKNGDEFFEYRIESWVPDLKRNQVHIRLYTKYNPIRIFDDNFELINK